MLHEMFQGIPRIVLLEIAQVYFAECPVLAFKKTHCKNLHYAMCRFLVYKL